MNRRVVDALNVVAVPVAVAAAIVACGDNGLANSTPTISEPTVGNGGLDGHDDYAYGAGPVTARAITLRGGTRDRAHVDVSTGVARLGGFGTTGTTAGGVGVQPTHTGVYGTATNPGGAAWADGGLAGAGGSTTRATDAGAPVPPSAQPDGGPTPRAGKTAAPRRP